MNLIHQVKKRWMVMTGNDDSPFDGETPFWIFSLVLHIVILFVLASLFVQRQENEPISVLVPPPEITELEDSPLLDVEYEEQDEIGSNDSSNLQAVMQMAPTVDDIVEVETDIQQELRDLGDIQMNEYIPEEQTAMDVNSIAVHGIAGQATQGTSGAIDRITHEILLSLEERKTLVVWMFDQSASLLRQRQEVVDRFDRVYSQLDEIQNSGNRAFQQHSDTPLLTQIYAFGSSLEQLLRKPTADLEEIKQAVRNIQTDSSGIENVFGSVAQVGSEYKNLSRINRRTGKKERNVMIIILSDEAGDDIESLDTAISICKKNQIRVYVIGVPAPFGRQHTFVKWQDPDPQYDQSVQWAPVRQGPESIMPERIKLHFTRNEQEEELFDSGFGPFGLTRLCFQTGGVYFTVHPNRKLEGKVPRWETSTYSAYLTRFFDPEVMRRYRPDYVSVSQYHQQLAKNQARFALVEAAQLSRVRPMQPPQLRFEKLDEARFVNEVTRAQRAAAIIEPKMDLLYKTLKNGERDREKEISPRWKAGYDLAMGRVMAVMVRAESYNAMLAMAKTKLKFQDPKNNTWVLRPADKISTGSQAEKVADKARFYLERVIQEHPGTPWAYLARAELKSPIGWQWREAYTEPPRPRNVARNNNNNNNNRPRPNPPRPPAQTKTKRPPPKL